MSASQTCYSSSWTREQDKAFENALAIYSEDSSDRWEKIAAMVPGKTIEEIKHHYQILVEDINAIESGYVPLPHYVDSTSRGGNFGQIQSDSCHGGKSSRSDQERRRGIAWSEEEHRLFLLGLEKYGKGDWRSISRHFVVSRTPTQVASHAQKYFIRLNSANKEKRRSSIHDITTVGGGNSSTSQGPITGQTDGTATSRSSSRRGKPAPSSEPDFSTYVPPTIVQSIGNSVDHPYPAEMVYGVKALTPGQSRPSMASTVTTVGAVNRTPLCLNSSSSGGSVPSSAFLGSSLKKVNSKFTKSKTESKNFKIVAEIDEKKQTDKDKWRGLAYDVSDDQQDITRGKGMVDSLFQAPMGAGTHDPVMSSYEYISTGLRQYNLDNNMDGFYIAPAFMDKLVVHITKNFMTLPNIKVPLILGIWGGKGQGKSFQCELVFAKMGINPIMMSAGELESGNAGEPAKLIRQRYREASDIIRKGKMCCLFINDLDAGAGRMGGTTQYTVNNQMVNATLMNIADNPTSVQLPGMYNKEDNARVPIIVTGNDFSTLYAPLIRDGRMEKFYWAPNREDRIGVCMGIFRTDNVPDEDVVKIVDTFPGQSIDFFGALRARVYDDEVRKWISGAGVDTIGKKLVNSKEGPPTFEQPKMTLEKLLEYGYMLVEEQENVKRVQLADKYLSEAALGDANQDSIDRGTF